jgi:hypothetical protein
MLCTYIILVTLFLIQLVSAIAPLIEDGENRLITKSYVIKNKKILANAVYIFEKKSLPLCSRRYQKITNTICRSRQCNMSRHADINIYIHQSSEEELRASLEF